MEKIYSIVQDLKVPRKKNKLTRTHFSFLKMAAEREGGSQQTEEQEKKQEEN